MAKSFDPIKFCRDRVAFNNHGYLVEHYPERPDESISEHIGMTTETRSAVIAITDENGEWFPVAESAHYPHDDAMNKLRRLAAAAIGAHRA